MKNTFIPDENEAQAILERVWYSDIKNKSFKDFYKRTKHDWYRTSLTLSAEKNQVANNSPLINSKGLITMKKTHYFVIGDVHGCLDELNELLMHHNPKTEQLVFIGDYIDRGPDSFGVLKRVSDLVYNHGAWALRGNHEELFLNADTVVDEELYLQNGGDSTYRSFPIEYDYWTSRHEQVNDAFPDVVTFIDSLPYFIETEHVIFAHAGIDPFDDYWQNSPKDCLWIRDFFHHSPTVDTRNVVFGHTPTQYLNQDESDDVWHKDNKLGIDGGCVFGGTLHGVKLTTKGDVTNIVSIKSNQ